MISNIQPKLQIFISSTFEDMRDERQTVMNAILSKKHIPGGMEYFSVEYLDQFKVIKEWIEMSDIFILVLGGRYGSICKDTGKSFVQMEFEYARILNKPVAVLLIDNEFLCKKKENAFKTGNMIYDLDRTDLYQAFVNDLKKLYRRYRNLDDLFLGVVIAIDSIIGNNENHFNGWIPMDTHAYISKDQCSINKGILESLLHRFLMSLKFEIKEIQIKDAGQGYYDSDKDELSTGQWDYWHPESLIINYYDVIKEKFEIIKNSYDYFGSTNKLGYFVQNLVIQFPNIPSNEFEITVVQVVRISDNVNMVLKADIIESNISYDSFKVKYIYEEIQIPKNVIDKYNL